MNADVEQGDELLAGFIEESIIALQDLPKQLGEHRENPDQTDAINAVFRSVHSIKGNAGFFGLAAIKKFSHALENTMDDVRNGDVLMSEDLERAITEGFDLLNEMLNLVTDGTVEEELRPTELSVLERVGSLAEEGRIGGSPEQILFSEMLKLADEISAATTAEPSAWAARLRDIASCHASEDGNEKGDESVEVCLPTAKHLSGRKFVHGDDDWTERLSPLLAMFVAMEDGEYSDELGRLFLEQIPALATWADEQDQDTLAAAIRSSSADFRQIFESPLAVDANLLSIVWQQLAPVLEPLCEEDVSEDADDSSEPADVPETKTVSAAQPVAAKARLVRIKEERLDEFLDDVSSLFITCERFKDVQQRMGVEISTGGLVEELRQINQTFSSQATDLQKSVVGLRKVPIRGLLSKFPRMARTLATNLGKKINVHLSGEEIEIDKALSEDLDAPLTHMIRNVADHAIETPEERIERGVEEAGNLWMQAELTRTHVVLTVRDDGRGIDPHRLRTKIVEKGGMTAAQAAALSDQEAVELIFHPGFSTAETISDVSGRGVGMDVVRTNLRDHGGEVHVRSQVGQGTTFTLEVPIRQAVVVVDGLLLEQGGEQFVIPLQSILEICEFTPDEVKPVRGAFVANIRDTTYEAVPLGDILTLPSIKTRHDGMRPGVLIQSKAGEVCLLVDQIIGQRKVVINGIEDVLPGVDHIAGVTQLGGGRLALVLSPDDLMRNLQKTRGLKVTG